MKTISKQFKLTSLFALIIIFSFSCSKDDDNKIATMQAKIDGSLFVCDSIVYLTEDLGGRLFGVEGYKKGNVGLKLLFPISNGVGRYPFLGFSGNYENEGWLLYGFQNQYKSTNGSVIISESQGRKYKGSFSFTAKSYGEETKEVSEGVFEISD